MTPKDSKSIEDFARYTCWVWGAKRITFRYYGNGQRRPLYHRFEVKGGISLSTMLAGNITRNNGLLSRLTRKSPAGGGFEIKGVTVEELLCYGEQPAAFPHLAGTPANLDDPTTRRPDPPPSVSES